MAITVADLRIVENGVPRALTFDDLLEVAAAVRLPSALESGRLAVRADGTVGLSSASITSMRAGPNRVVRGNVATTVSQLSPGDRLHSILVMPTDGGQVTVTVFDDAADATPIDFPYAEDFKGRVAPTLADVDIAGDVAYYRVTFEAV